MINDSRIREYFVLRFVPSVFSDASSLVGIILREIEMVYASARLRFVGAKFVEAVSHSYTEECEADKLLIGEAVKEIRQTVERANESGEEEALKSLLQVLLHANSGLCAVGPHACQSRGTPEEQLQSLFERNRPASTAFSDR